MTRFRGFVGPSYTLSTVPLDCQETVNLFPEPDELQTGKDGSIGALVDRPGLVRRCVLPQSPVRGIWRVSRDGQVFAVGGGGLFKIAPDWTVTKIGTLKTDSGAVSMSDNGTQLIVVDGVFGYLVDLASNIFSVINSPAFYSSRRVIFLDGYFALVRPGTDQVYTSGQYDGASYAPLDFTTIEASPDKTVTLESFRNQLVAFGERSTAFYVTGQSNIFDRIQGAQLEHGCAAPLSVAKDGETLLWLGQNEYGSGVVYRAAGYQTQRASNYGVELAIQGYGDISDANAFMFQMRGHSFYVLNFTSADTTWVFDATMGQWVEWKSVNATGRLGRWRANCHVFAFDQHIVGDFSDGRIYTLDFSAKTDDGEPLIRRRRAPVVSTNLKRAIHSKFQLDARVGVGTDAGQGQQPTVMLRYSDDGGLSWSSEKWADLGRRGETLARVIWRRLGASRSRVYEVTVTDPVEVALIGADLDLTGGGS